VENFGLLALLYALDRMCELKDLEGIERVVKKLLEEAESEKKTTKEKEE
jgi:hypothetical protein